MAIEITMYGCEVCQSVFPTPDEADACRDDGCPVNEQPASLGRAVFDQVINPLGIAGTALASMVGRGNA